jgi:hypothetical protein
MNPPKTSVLEASGSEPLNQESGKLCWRLGDGVRFMTWRSHVWRVVSRLSLRSASRWACLTLPGWREGAPAKGLRVWRDSDGDVLSLAAPGEGLGLPQGSEVELKRWCRELAQERGGGLIEAHGIGPSACLIYKRLQMPAYVYTGMFISVVQGFTLVWTVVAGERGATGVREAVVTADLMNAGTLTLDGYRHSWAQDPYDPAYQGVDRSVLRFISDDASYDEQFPHHPLSKVRRVLRALPAAMQFDPPKASKARFW